MFNDRIEAGALLSQKLSSSPIHADIVLGLARGGVVVSTQIGKAQNIPHDVLVVKKIASPHDSELAIGALAPDGVMYVDYKMAQMSGADEIYIKTQIAELSDQIKEKALIYRKGKPPLSVKNQTVFIVDDGAATGATIFAAVSWAKKKHARKIIVGLPVAPSEIIGRLKSMADDCIILSTERDFGSVGEFYKNFPQLTDEEVVALLSQRI